MTSFIPYLFAGAFLSLIGSGSGLRCYGCSGNTPESDCEVNLEQMNPKEVVKTCKPQQKYCTVRRQVLVRSPQVTIGIFRSCLTIPEAPNGLIEDDTYITYYYSCKTDLCNTGIGTTIDSEDNRENQNRPDLPSYEELLGHDASFQLLPSPLVLIFSFIALMFLSR